MVANRRSRIRELSLEKEKAGVKLLEAKNEAMNASSGNELLWTETVRVQDVHGVHHHKQFSR